MTRRRNVLRTEHKRIQLVREKLSIFHIYFVVIEIFARLRTIVTFMLSNAQSRQHTHTIAQEFNTHEHTPSSLMPFGDVWFKRRAIHSNDWRSTMFVCLQTMCATETKAETDSNTDVRCVPSVCALCVCRIERNESSMLPQYMRICSFLATKYCFTYTLDNTRQSVACARLSLYMCEFTYVWVCVVFPMTKIALRLVSFLHAAHYGDASASGKAIAFLIIFMCCCVLGKKPQRA